MDGFCCGGESVVEVNSGVFEILKELTLIDLLLWDGTCWFLAESFDVRHEG